MKQDYRAERGLLFIENLLADLRNAVRTIRRMPVLAAVIIVSLAIGIGVNTTIFSWIQMILFEPMPAVGVPRTFCWPSLARDADTQALPGWNIATCRLKCRRCGHRGISNVPFNVGEKGQTERTHGQLVSGNYSPRWGSSLRSDDLFGRGG